MSEDKGKLKVHVNPAAARASENALTPLTDIYQTPDGTTVLVVEVPGASPGEVDVRVDKGVLTIRAEGAVPEAPEGYGRIYAGFTGGEFFRAFALSDEVDRDRIEASVSGGLLTVRLPRAAAAQSRKIEIKNS